MGAPYKEDWREARRKRAWNLGQQGWSQKDIAAVLGVSAGAVSHWLKRGRADGGEAALTRHPAPGRVAPLTPDQRVQIPTLLERGAEVIAQEFGVRYSRDHASSLLRHPAPKRSASGARSAGLT